MSPAVSTTKKRKAKEIDSSHNKDEQTTKAKKLVTGERKY